MNIFSMLILERMRFIFLLTNSPGSKALVKDRVSADDFAFIEKQCATKAVTSAMMVALLEAADTVGRAAIASLPLELAVVKVCAA